MRSEEGISFHFLQRERDGFLAEGAADLLEGVELACRCFFDQVDVGEATLMRNLAISSVSTLKQEVWVLTSPSNRKILKLRLLILSFGELGRQDIQPHMESRRSITACAMLAWGNGMQSRCKGRVSRESIDAIRCLLVLGYQTDNVEVLVLQRNRNTA